MRLFDTHAHLQDDAFSHSLDEVIERAVSAGLERIICVGVDAASSQQCVELTGRFSLLSAAVGIQPNYVSQATNADWDAVLQLAQLPPVVALGETGLDRFWDRSPFALQQNYFDRHIRLSQVTGLPLIIHMRECDDELLEMLSEASHRAPLRGVMHSFTGRVETAAKCLELGLSISFAGMVTYKKADELRRIAQTIPLDRILIETDSPYLSPHPKRSQRPNEPALLIHTAECLADTLGLDIATFAEHTTENARQLFSRR